MAELRVLLSQQVRSPTPQPSSAPPTAGTITQLQLTASREQDLQALLVAQQTIADLRVCTYSVLFAPVAHTCMESHTCTDSPKHRHPCIHPSAHAYSTYMRGVSHMHRLTHAQTSMYSPKRTCIQYIHAWSLTHAQTHPRTDIHVFTQAHMHTVHTYMRGVSHMHRLANAHMHEVSHMHRLANTHMHKVSHMHRLTRTQKSMDSPTHMRMESSMRTHA